MLDDPSDFEEVLKKAQELGYAERNPAADVEGYDACRKIAILSSLAYGCHVDFEDIYTEGITKITDIDFKYAKKLGLSIKLFGKSKKVDDKCYAMVAPFMIDSDNPLYSVNGVLNGILVKGDVIGDVMFYGAGAGKLPTASAVVADIVDSAIHNERRKLIGWTKPETDTSADADSKKFRYFIRTSDDKETVKAVFSNVTEIECLAQTDFAFITEPLSVSELNIEKSKLGGIKTAIRVLD